MHSLGPLHFSMHIPLSWTSQLYHLIKHSRAKHCKSPILKAMNTVKNSQDVVELGPRIEGERAVLILDCDARDRRTIVTIVSEMAQRIFLTTVSFQMLKPAHPRLKSCKKGSDEKSSWFETFNEKNSGTKKLKITPLISLAQSVVCTGCVDQVREYLWPKLKLYHLYRGNLSWLAYIPCILHSGMYFALCSHNTIPISTCFPTPFSFL